jgi:hypothetical protein
MAKDRNGGFESKSTMKVTATETSRRVEFEIPQEEQENVTAGLLKNNHLRGLYDDYCILNQEFLSYVVSCKLTGIQSRMLFFLMSEMDKENKILLNNDLLIKEIGGTKKSIIDATARLENLKIIVRQKLGTARYEYQIRYDMINPQMAFKNKSSRENVQQHKALIQQEAPYMKQWNTDGNIDLINSSTGEIFETKIVVK